MKMKSESEFSSIVKSKLGVVFKIQSFESSDNKSTPDLYLVDILKGHSLWIELKVEKKNGEIEFQPGQVQWIEHHTRANGLAYVMILRLDLTVELWPAYRARWLSNTKSPAGYAPSYSFPLVTGDWKGLAESIYIEIDDKWGCH
jgi:hypothetical protein